MRCVGHSAKIELMKALKYFLIQFYKLTFEFKFYFCFCLFVCKGVLGV